MGEMTQDMLRANLGQKLSLFPIRMGIQAEMVGGLWLDIEAVFAAWQADLLENGRNTRRLEQDIRDRDRWLEANRKRIETLERAVVIGRFMTLPDVERVEVVGTEAIIHITGTRYDDAQMDRLLEVEAVFLGEFPDARLSFRYIPSLPPREDAP